MSIVYLAQSAAARWGVCLALLGFVGANDVFAQTSNPFSGFGVGDLQRGSLARNFGMGGSGVAAADPFHVNRMNPASYADLRFMTLDFSGFVQKTIIQTESQKSEYTTGGIQGISFVFKKLKPIAVSGGIAPYSSMGYSFVTDTTYIFPGADTADVTSRRQGSGGLTELYIGGAFKTLKRRLGIGLDIRYLFGKLTTNWITGINSPTAGQTVINKQRYISGFAFRGGLTYVDTLKFIAPDALIRLGFTVDYQPPLSLARMLTTTQIGANLNGAYSVGDTLVDEKTTVNIPPVFSIGLAFDKTLKYAINLDFSYQDWSKFRYEVDDRNLYSTWRTCIGGEFIPDFRNIRSFFARVAYRAGFNFEQTYLRINEQNIYAYGGSVGFGIPLSVRASNRINIGVEYRTRGQMTNNLIQESGYRFVFGVSFNEIWFSPRKYD